MPQRSRRAARTPGERKPPPWAGRPVVVLVGGPHDPRWLFADGERSLASDRRAAEANGRTWPYVATGRYEPHPDYDVAGEVHELRRAPARTAGELARDEGIARTTAAHPDAFAAALRIVRDTAARLPEFSANSTRDAMEAAGVPGPVVGAAFRRAVATGAITPAGYREKSTQAETHAHRIEVYRSLIAHRAAS